MKTKNSDSFFNIDRGLRLKEERLRQKKMSQVEASKIADVAEQSWVRYEKHGAAFDLNMVQNLESYGFDMMYVIFGIRKEEVNSDIQPEAIKLLKLYESVPLEKRKYLIDLIEVFVNSCSDPLRDE